MTWISPRYWLGYVIWTILTFPLVLIVGVLWPAAWLIMQERPDIYYREALKWAWAGFPKEA